MKPTTATKSDTAPNTLTVTDGDLNIRFVKDAVGRIYIRIYQSSAKNVEVTLHRFFQGAVSEMFYAEDFTIEGEEFFIQQSGFPDDLYTGLMEKKIKVSVRFAD